MLDSGPLTPSPDLAARSDGFVRMQCRRLLTGFCFLLFGLGSLDIAFVIFPLVLVFTRRERRRVCIQRVISWHFRVFLNLLEILGLMSLKTEHLERLKNDNGTLIIANHPTLIDVVVLMAFLPEVDCVVKAGLNKNIVLRGVVKAAGYITNSDPETLLAGCSDRLKRGRNMIVFPEGTRTVEGQAFCFQRGVAHVALRAHCPIRPVYLTCSPATLSKQHKWYQIPERPFEFRVSVGETLDFSQWQGMNNVGIATRQLTRALEQHYGDVFAVHDGALK